MYKENNKLIKQLRRYETFYLEQFKETQRLKKEYFKKDSNNWKKLKKLLLKEDSEYLIYILKQGFRVRPAVIQEDCYYNRINKIFDSYQLPTSILEKAIGDNIAFADLLKEERFYINQLIVMHYPLVVSIVSKSTKQSPFLSNYFTEIYNEGIFGIIHTIHKFEPGHGAIFSTYAFKWVQYYIHKYINKLIRDINFVNGNGDIHLYTKYNTYYDYNEYIENLQYCSIDLLTEFPNIDFITEDKIHSNLNKIINSNRTRKHLIKLCQQSGNEDLLKILSLKKESKIICHLLLEKLLKLKPSQLEIEETQESINHSTALASISIDNNHNNFESNNALKSLLNQINLSKSEMNLIESYLNEKNVNNIRFNNLLSKLKESIKDKDISMYDYI
jgi:RNA polymerase sigma factor (sigma-70 family)